MRLPRLSTAALTATIAAVAAVLAPAPVAHAQVGLNPLSPLRLKAGGYFAGGDYSLLLGTSYDVNSTRVALLVPVVYSLYADAAFGERDFVGLGAQARVYVTPVAVAGTRLYVGGGLGYYDRDEGDGLGGKLFAGAEFARRFFGEFAYQRPGGGAGNGVELSLGLRF